MVALFVPAKRWVDETVAPARWVDEPGVSPPHRLRSTSTFLAIAAFLVVVAGAAVFAIGNGPRSSSSSGTFGSLDSSQNKATEAERDCIATTAEQDDTFMRQATVTSERDADKSVLNLDGDSSYQLYAQHVRALDISACPADFQLAFERWGSLWLEYGDFLKEAAQPHAPWNDEWSDSSKETREAEFRERVRDAREALRESAMLSAVNISQALGK